ncbi:MAG TPA: hypothetical protein VIL16_18195 [Trebonia sp.]
MHVPSQSSHDPLPSPPPAIVRQASKDEQDRLKHDLFEVAGDLYKVDVQGVIPVGEERVKDRPDLHDELEAATNQVNDERNRPAEVRRADRSRGKRGR